MMTAACALAILAFLREAGVPAWVDGGWAVDALLGEETRPHADLDIAVPLAFEARLRAAAAAHGFAEVSAEPHNPVLRDELGRLLDVHFFDPAIVQDGPQGRPAYGAIAYDVGSFAGEGTIAGVPVPCVGAEYLVRYHTGYAFDADDVHDVLALHRRFGIPLPPEYAPYAGS
ncbi:MAG: hypothetical protein IT303_17410 [Dehalococcoidia bacterium]|nr:hypothetical protein [Dehalococcoidia bacterium]